jgi:transcriptional regulator with XRE-family HTH domain
MVAAAEEQRPFGVLLQRHRLAAGPSQEELAERAGLSRRGISDLERGARRAPYPANVRRLAEALGLDPTERAGLLASAHPGAISDTPATLAPALQAQQRGGEKQLPGVAISDIEASRTARHNLPAELTIFIVGSRRRQRSRSSSVVRAC